MPVLPLPTLFLLGDKTFNYRYLVPLRIPNVLIASPPRTSFHGKIIAKSQGEKERIPTPVGSLPRGDREKKGDRSCGPVLPQQGRELDG